MFNLLRLARLLARYKPSSSITINWTQGDANNLTSFFESATGQKLDAIAGSHIAQAAMNACAAKEDSDRHVAQGVRITWATIDSLKFRTPQSQEGTTERDDDRIPEAFQ